MPRRHRVLLILWGLMVAMSAGGWIGASGILAVIPFFLTMPLAVFTYRGVERSNDLKRRLLYRVLVGTLLLGAAATAIASGSTLFISSKGPLPVVGFSVLGATNVLVVILTWRALVEPTTRRAALAGMVAVLTECMAMTIDIMMNMHVPGFEAKQPALGLAILGAMVATYGAWFACIAALATFDHDLPDMPQARVVDGD